MATWSLFVILGAGLAYLAGRGVLRRSQQTQAADASGLTPVGGLGHLPPALQKTALWSLSDGGFERRVAHGVMSRNTHDIDVTAFDLETLRDRRGEWAFLPVARPFRIGPMVSIVACEVDRAFPHVLLKRAGAGDDLAGDDPIERIGHLAKAVRATVGMPQSYPAEMPATLGEREVEVELPDGWRAYGDAEYLRLILANGFAAALVRTGRRDLVVELLDTLIVVYPAMRDVVGADAFADLTSTALAITDGVLASSPALSPRGVETQRVDGSLHSGDGKSSA